MSDGRCKFGLRAKREMIERLEQGESARSIARSMGCSPTTVCTARSRWLACSPSDRAAGQWALPMRPIPRSCPWALSASEEQRILDARAKTNWGPMQLQVLTGRHRSTIWKVLHRRGVSRRPPVPRRSSRRYEWAEAGALLHIDALQVPKFDRPGHWATGQRAEQHKSRQAGTTYVIGVIDDHTRLAYCELHSSETPRPSPRPCGAPARGSSSRAAARCRRSCATTASMLLQKLRVRRAPLRARRPPDPHAALHPPLEREDLCLSVGHAVRQGGEAPRACRFDSGKRRAERELICTDAGAECLFGLRSICRPAGCGRAGNADLIGDFAPMWLHRHRSVACRPGLDSTHEPGGHLDRRHRRSQAHPRRRADR